MNFKATTNIPRDQVKGFIEPFGGAWNGYTWLDQTTYLETASRDALDRMLFIEAERMGRCLYDQDDRDSERTVIISKLKGGENGPDSLLDQEVVATTCTVTTAATTHPTTPPSSSSATSVLKRRWPGFASTLAASRPAVRWFGA